MPTRKARTKTRSKSVTNISVPKLAKKLISENKGTKAKFLDLSNCGLAQIPPEVGELVWLESLSLTGGGVWYEWDGEEWQEKKSQHEGGRNYALSDLTALASLTCLKALYLDQTQVGDLEPLGELTAVRCVSFFRTPVSDLAPLARLPVLESLHANSTPIKDLTPIASRLALQSLIISGTTRVSSLQDLTVGVCWTFRVGPLAGLRALHYFVPDAVFSIT